MQGGIIWSQNSVVSLLYGMSTMKSLLYVANWDQLSLHSAKRTDLAVTLIELWSHLNSLLLMWRNNKATPSSLKLYVESQMDWKLFLRVRACFYFVHSTPHSSTQEQRAGCKQSALHLRHVMTLVWLFVIILLHTLSSAEITYRCH